MKGYISLLFIHLVQPDWGGEGTLDKVGHLLTIKGNIKPRSPQKLMDKIFLFSVAPQEMVCQEMCD